MESNNISRKNAFFEWRIRKHKSSYVSFRPVSIALNMNLDKASQASKVSDVHSDWKISFKENMRASCINCKGINKNQLNSQRTTLKINISMYEAKPNENKF